MDHVAAGPKRRPGASVAVSVMPPAPPTPAGIAVLPFLVLLFVLVLIIGAGLLYLTVAHPALAVPLTVAAGGVTVMFTIAGVIAAFMTASRRTSRRR